MVRCSVVVLYMARMGNVPTVTKDVKHIILILLYTLYQWFLNFCKTRTRDERLLENIDPFNALVRYGLGMVGKPPMIAPWTTGFCVGTRGLRRGHELLH